MGRFTEALPFVMPPLLVPVNGDVNSLQADAQSLLTNSPRHTLLFFTPLYEMQGTSAGP